MYMIFLNLVVEDLARARSFYGKLGFRLETHSSDDRSAAMIVDDTIVIVLMTEDTFAELAPGVVGHPADSTTSIYQLTVGGRDEVDDLVAKAAAAGGTTWSPGQDEAATHRGGFRDPDGHAWLVSWLEPMHVID